MADKNLFSPAGSPDRMRCTRLSGTFTIGAAGAITANDSSRDTGCTVTKTAAQTGRYDLLFFRNFTRIVVGASMVGPTTAAFGNAAGNTLQVRNQQGIVNAVAATGSNAQVQAFIASTGADTDVPSGTIINWWADCYGK